VQDIADSMGVSRPTLYYYVKSKDDLLARLVTEDTEGAAAQIRALARDPERPPPNGCARSRGSSPEGGQRSRPGSCRSSAPRPCCHPSWPRRTKRRSGTPCAISHQ
jgi:AcrR family transcriptional regulator